MFVDSATTHIRLEAALTRQLSITPVDDAVGAAGDALLAVLEPALRMAVFDLAEQAAAEIGAQLPGHNVDVIITDGQPELRIGGESAAPPATDEDYEARISLRLPPSLKQRIEESAAAAGDSVNSWLVKTISAQVNRPRVGTRIKGRIET